LTFINKRVNVIFPRRLMLILSCIYKITVKKCSFIELIYKYKYKYVINLYKKN